MAALALPAGTLTDQGRAVVAAIAAGKLAPSQGAALLASLGTLAKLTEADELKRRIAALEGKRRRPLGLSNVEHCARTTRPKARPLRQVRRFGVPFSCTSGYMNPRNNKAQPCGLG